MCNFVRFAGPLALCLIALLRPVPSFAQPLQRWYLAEGATNAFFEEEILIANPSAASADIKITYLLMNGAPVVQTFTMTPTSRHTVRVNSVMGLENTGAVSAVVECTNGHEIVVERSMYWADGQRYGGHNANGITETATDWFLAEGSTGFFDDFVLIANPSATQTAAVNVTFLLENGTTVPRTYQIAPNSRFNIWTNLDIPELANKAFSTTVRSTNGVEIAVERAMYFGPGREGGHESAGVTEAKPNWFFAEGFTGPGGTNPLQFDTFLLLSNPGTLPATANVTFFREGGTPIQRIYDLPPTSRLNVWVDLVPGLEAAAFSTRVTSTQPIVCERAMYWGKGSGDWLDAHNTPGVTEEALKWAFAEGVEDGIDNSGTFYDSYYLLVNTSATPAQIRATFMREDGTGIVRDLSVPAASRFTLWTEPYPELSNQRFAAFFESTNSVTFVAERAVYWGEGYRGGHASRGTPWTGTIGTPATPPNPTLTSISPTTGLVSGGTAVTLTGTNFAAGATVTIGGLPATDVVVLNAQRITARTPMHTTVGSVNVAVTTAGQTLQLPNGFTYSSPPVVTSISPTSGPTSGATTVTIRGTFFTTGATVTIAGVAANNVVVVDSETITARTGPRSSTGTGDVVVTIGGLSDALPGAFTYIPTVPTTLTDVSLAFGDSITYGTTSSVVSVGTAQFITTTRDSFQIEGYPGRLRSLLQARYTTQSISVANLGIPGELAVDGASRLPGELTASQDLVMILEGVNDINAGVPIGDTRAALRGMVQDAKAAGKKVILMTLLPVVPSAGGSGSCLDPGNLMCRVDMNRIKQLNEVIADIATLQQVNFVDMYGVFGGDNPNAGLLSPDGLHPNEAGYQRMAEAIFDRIRASFEGSPGT